MASKKTIKRKAQKEGKEPIGPVGKRTGKIILDANHRERIKTSQILNRLESFVLDEEGDVEMAPHKVSAALGLLKKVMPDLQSTHETKDLEGKTHEEWLDDLERRTSQREVERGS